MDKQKAGLLGLVTILVLYGGGLTLTQPEFDKTYYCPLTQQIAVFDRLSSTEKTGYYTEEGIEKSLACRSGKSYAIWEPLAKYLSDNNVSIDDLIQPTYQSEAFYIVNGIQGQYICDVSDNNYLYAYTKCYSGGLFKAYAGELVCG